MTPLDRINGYAHVALRYGLEEAIFLDSIMFWYRENRANQRNFLDGRYWTYNSINAFAELFPWWSGKQLRRIISSCKEKGAILSGNYSQNQRDRTLWYTPSDTLLELYGIAQTGNCICPDGQMEMPKRADETAQTGKCNIEHVKNHVETNMNNPIVPCANDPDWKIFDSFWAAYPRKEAKDRARRAWKKLNPGPELCQIMADALEKDKQSRQWQKDDGEYIPHPASWLNGRRWKDEHRPSSAGSAPSPDEPLRGEGVRYR